MTAAKRRSRRPRNRQRTGDAPPGPATTPPRIAPLPEWKWRTFPVFFAFTLGGFIGVYAGFIAAEASPTTQSVIFIIFASLMGFGMARMGTQWLKRRQVIKPRPR